MRLAPRLLLGSIAVLGLVIAAGALYQWRAARADRVAVPAPGRIVTVDGLDLHIDCRGSGRPVVILEAGLTSGSTSWALVHDAISRVTEVCAYDRPGLDWSAPGRVVPRAPDVAARLRALLAAANVDGPYLLVGMSAGGVYVREFYRQHADDVVGMVLVDSSHEQQAGRLPGMDGAENLDRLLRLCAWLQPFGVVRLTGALEPLLGALQIPPEALVVARANANQSHTCAAIRAEQEGFAADLARAAAPTPLGDLPLTVLSQGAEPAAVEILGQTLDQARAMRTVWDVLQLELTALSTRGQRIIATRSGHLIHLEQPELVIDAVADMVAAGRGSAP